MKKVFLGGTCADSRWREELMPMLNIDYFNPVVKRWTPECQKEEIRQRETCDYVLYVLSRIKSAYSIAEAIDDSNKRPDKTIVCVLEEKRPDGKSLLNPREIKGLKAVSKMAERNGAVCFNNLKDVAEYLNKNK